MRKDERLIVESVMKDIIKIEKEKVLMERYLETLALTGGADVAFSGGVPMSEQDRYLNAKDNARLQRLQRILLTIERGYLGLTHEERRIIVLTCLLEKNMDETAAEVGLSRRHVQRIKTSAFHKLCPFCIEVYPDIRKWREYNDVEISNKLMPLLNSRRGVCPA